MLCRWKDNAAARKSTKHHPGLASVEHHVDICTLQPAQSVHAILVFLVQVELSSFFFKEVALISWTMLTIMILERGHDMTFIGET